MLKLSLSLEITLGRLPRDYGSFEKVQHELSEIHKIISDKIHFYEERVKKTGSSHHQDILRQLSGYNIIHIRNIIYLNPKNESQYLNSILDSWINVKNQIRLGNYDPFVEYQVNKAFYDLAPHLKRHCDNMQKVSSEKFNIMINSFITRFGITLPTKVSWKGEFPNYKIISGQNILLSINILTGDIYQNSIQKKQLPSNVFTNPIYNKIIKYIPSELSSVSPDKTVYEFTVQGILYRFDTKPRQSQRDGILYRQMLVNGKQEWYEYQTQLINGLPLSLNESQNSIWVSTSKSNPQHTIIMNETTKQMLALAEADGKILELNKKPQGNTTGYYLINNSTSIEFMKNYESLTSIEDPEMIQIWKSDALPLPKGEIEIRLIRYGLSFKQKINQDGSLGDMIWMQDPRYKIKLPADILIPNFDSILQLQSIHKDLEDIALIPRKMFISTNEPEQEYFKIKLDTRLKSKPNKDEPVFFDFDRLDSLYSIDSQKSNYTNQETYIKCSVQPSLELTPETTNDRIGLAYVLLGKRQTLLAYDCLKKVIPPLTDKQLDWVYNIMFNIPINTQWKSTSDKGLIESPEFMAVRTLALSILAEHHFQNLGKAKPPKKPRNEPEIIGSPKITRIDKMLNMYADYLKKLKKVPELLRLDPKRERQLLRYLILKRPNVAPHIRFRRQQLAIKSAITEQRRLEIQIQHYKPETKDYNRLFRRVEKLKLRIKRLGIVPRPQSVLKTIPISLFPDSELIYPYPSVAKLLWGNRKALANVQSVPVDKLNLYTNDTDFYFSYASYFNLALETKDDTDQRKQLYETVQFMLKSIAYKKHENQSRILSLKENLIVLLAYVLKYPNSFRKPHSGESLEEYFSIQLETIQKLKVEGKDIQIPLDIRADAMSVLTIPEVVPEVAAPLNIDNPKIFTVEEERPNLLLVLKNQFSGYFASEFEAFAKSKEFQAAEAQKIEIKSKMEVLQAQLNLQSPKTGHSIDLRTRDVDLKLRHDDKKYQHEFNTVQTTLMLEKLKDDLAGIDKNLRLHLKNRVAHKICDQFHRTADTKILKEFDRSMAHKNQQLDLLKQQIINLANKVPSDLLKQIDWELQHLGKERSILNFDRILRMFLTQDSNYFKQFTSLEDEDIKTLNNLIFQFLNESTHLQHEQRLAKSLGKLFEPGLSTENRMAEMNTIGTLLEVERCYDPTLDPEILVFEYLEDKLLYKEQYEYLKGFLKQNENGFNSQAVQLIMGGGKSKILLPLLALKKATGENLSIIEVPDALFQVNKADLSGITKDKFGQDLQSFYFNDTIHCDSNYLKNLRNKIRDAMENRQSLITTKESMQAFELNFLKFVKFMDPLKPENIKKSKLYTEILNIFKYQGDVIIDEIDSTLDVRKQLIHTVGSGTGIPKTDLKSVLDLFLFLGKLSVIIPGQPRKIIAIKNLIQGNQACSDVEWNAVFNFISYQLVNDISIAPPTNPLKGIMTVLLRNKSEGEVKQLKDSLIRYLLGKQKEPDFLSGDILSRIEKDQLAIYKEQISTILPLTLKKNIEEHFGLPLDRNKQPIDREIAIPYLASNTPSESSRFGNYLETINYTLRIQLNQPLSYNVVKSMIHQFKTRADEERRLYANLPKSPNYKSPEDEFLELTKYKLEDIDFEDIKGLHAFYYAINSNPKVKEYCLLNHILNHIERHDCVLASDAQNHGSQFRSVQGMTGTDWNYRCYPNEPNVVTNKEVSLGSDGQTRNHLQRDPKPAHLITATLMDNESKFKSALELFSKHPIKKSLHAWIDLGAYFKGISNNTVAGHFSKFFASDNNFKHLKYVLFFDQDNKLYALPTSTSEGSTPILLERTDSSYILQKLNTRDNQGEKITLDNIFTYYDQRRTTGTDIAQDSNAHAFVPIGLHTIDRDLLQGVMRMRELRGNQRVEFVVPKEVQDANPTIKHWDVNAILQFSFNNQVERLADDHYRSALQKIQNVIRNDLFKRLLASDPIQQKELMDHFDQVFFKIDMRSAFERYGMATTKVLTQTKLEEYAQAILEQWTDIMQSSKIPDVSSNDVSNIQNKLLDIITSSVDICNREVEHLKSATSLYDSQVEVTKEEEVEKEEELELQLFVQGDIKPADPDKLKIMNFDIMALSQGEIPGGGGLVGIPLENIAQIVHPSQDKDKKRATEDQKLSAEDVKQSAEDIKQSADIQSPDKRTWNFNANLYASKNFAHTYKHQSKFIDGYTKDSIFFLVEQDDQPPGSIKFLLITPEEAAHIRDNLRDYKQTGNKRFWVETAHHTLHSGIKPGKLHPDYEKSIEQIAYFGADTDVLFYNLNKDSWIIDKASEKLQYLEHVLYPIHRDKVNMIDSLREKVAPAPKKPPAFPMSGPKKGIIPHTAKPGSKPHSV